MRKLHGYSNTVKDAKGSIVFATAAVWDGDDRRAAVAKILRLDGVVEAPCLPVHCQDVAFDPRRRKAGCLLRHHRTGEEKALALRPRRVAAIGGEPRRGGLARPQNLAVSLWDSLGRQSCDSIAASEYTVWPKKHEATGEGDLFRRRFLQADVGFRPNDPRD
jgi:hypothetical protein